MKVLEDLIAPAFFADLVSRLIAFLISRYSNRACFEETAIKLELLVLKIHAVIQEAEHRHIAGNQSLLLWLKKLMKGMYQAYYVLDSARHPQDDQYTNSVMTSGRSLNLSRFCCPAKRPRTVATDSPVNNYGSIHQLSSTLAFLEDYSANLRDLILLLACCPPLPIRQPVSDFLSDERNMFGRLVEREQIISFVMQPGNHLGVLPIVGGPEVGKGTIIKHVCNDDRVRNCFDMILYSYGSILQINPADDVLETLTSHGHILHQADVSPSSLHRKHLIVIKNTYEVVIDKVAWATLCASLRSIGNGSKIIMVSENDNIKDLGTTGAMRIDPLLQEEYWYFIRSLAFGSAQIAAALNGSLFGAKVLGRLLRANLDEQFWHTVLNTVYRFHEVMQRDKYFTKLSIARVALRVLPMALRLKSASQTGEASEVPGIMVQELVAGSVLPVEKEMEVVLWESAYQPSYRYTVVCERVEKPHCSQPNE
uniref:NB-ARC domain-containing protein n=1 Tax=Oryza meridionalis TaxID=40149 RepID=A0A0E0F5P8_9ORYZ